MSRLVLFSVLSSLVLVHVFCHYAPHSGRTRMFYIAAVDTEWDYAPLGNLVNDDTVSDDFLQAGPNRIGGKYTKAVYREFTDESFLVQSPRPDWLGLLGPVFRAEVGDTIIIRFANLALKCNRSLTLHAHGVAYEKNAEGALYRDNTGGKDKLDDGVPPGGFHTYTWEARKTFAPTEGDDNCLPWAYHSHLDSKKDVSTGTAGIFLTCKRGNLGDSKRSWVATVNLYPASLLSAHMVAEHPGIWLLNSRVNKWYRDGMQAFVTITPSQHLQHPGHNHGPAIFSHGGTRGDHSQRLGSHFLPPHQSSVRRYYIAAEKMIWDYGPSGNDLYNGGSLTNPNGTSSTYYTRSNDRIGGQYIKALYIEYTDASFTHKKPRTVDEIHLGFMGPVIKAEVGDTVEIVFRNMADRDFSFYPHGLTFPQSEQGFLSKNPFTNLKMGKFARPGETVVYKFKVTEQASPTESDPPCLTSMYYSAVDPVRDPYTGLLGPLVICKSGQAFDWKFEGLPRHWSAPPTHRDREFYLMFSAIDENESWYIDENIQMFALTPSSVMKTDPGFVDSNIMYALNGRGFGNLQGMDMCIGDHVTWHVFGLGSDLDLHGFNINGQTMEYKGNHVETKTIIPGLGATLHSVPDSVGRWSVHCRSNFHFTNGIVALYDVFKCGARDNQHWRQHGRTRRYFIAAEEVIWDYAPLLVDLTTGEPLTDPSSDGYNFVRTGSDFIGSKYKKAIYRGYTDATFTRKVVRGPEEEHLGILGPVIRAEVGDVIEVIFKNKASRNYSIHPQGLFYDKGSEGAEYQDGSTLRGDNQVPPGGVYVYRWEVPARSGPGKTDPNCISWIYHSSVDPSRDTLSGLIGSLVVCRSGTLDHNGRRKDNVRREFHLLFQSFNENESHYFKENVELFAPNRNTNVFDFGFFFSNFMFSINGLIYGNVNGLTMTNGETVAWHILALGSIRSIHPVHFHGHSFIHRTDRAHRKDVIEVFPSITETVEMFLDSPGTWLLHCHKGTHVKSGMSAVYTVLPKLKTRYRLHPNNLFYYTPRS